MTDETPQQTTATEQTLARVWEEVLEVDGLGPSDDFFELGGHSLAAIEVQSMVADELGVDLPLSTFFEATRLDALAAVVDEASQTETDLDRSTEGRGGPGGDPGSTA